MQERSLTPTIDETNLVLEALGNLPFARVFTLLGQFQEQARQQLSHNMPSPGTNAADTPALTRKGAGYG